MKFPIRDDDTVPWIARREIPAIKAVLSEWRKIRRDPEHREYIANYVASFTRPMDAAIGNSRLIAQWMEELTLVNERLKKERS